MVTRKVAHRYARYLSSWDVEIYDSLVGQLTTRRVDFARFAGKWRRQNDVGTVGKGTVPASEQRKLLITDFKTPEVGFTVG